jgi:hypothetical protein
MQQAGKMCFGADNNIYVLTNGDLEERQKWQMMRQKAKAAKDTAVELAAGRQLGPADQRSCR